MSPSPFQRLSRSLHRVVLTDPSTVAATEAIRLVDEHTMIRVLDLAMRIGESLLAVGASAHEATLAVTRVAQAYDLNSVHVDVTYNSITVSYHRGEDYWPTTIARVVKITVPDFAKLQQLQALVADTEYGMDLDEARARFRTIRRTPFLYRPFVVLLSRALLAAGVAVMFGTSPLIAVLSFVAALCASLVQAGLAKKRVPLFFSQIAGGFSVTAVAVAVSALGRAGVEPFVGLHASIIVASGIVLMLAGLTVVGAVQDAIDGFAVTATGRILDLTLQTLGVVVGILAGLELGRALGFSMALPSEPPAFGSPLDQLLGAVVVSAAVALTNGATFRTVMVSGLLSIITMVSYIATNSLNLHAAVAAGIGATCGSFVGALIAHRLHVPSVAVTTAAIIPLVPGITVFSGLLELVQANEQVLARGAGLLTLAAVIGIALATGASLGLSLGTPVRATLDNVVRGRARAH
ncbi:MAG: threonine/serine exporter ThrE family protein [Leucobacter sp.]